MHRVFGLTPKKCTRKLFFKAYDAVPPKKLQGKEEKELIIHI